VTGAKNRTSGLSPSTQRVLCVLPNVFRHDALKTSLIPLALMHDDASVQRVLQHPRKDCLASLVGPAPRNLPDFLGFIANQSCIPAAMFKLRTTDFEDSVFYFRQCRTGHIVCQGYRPAALPALEQQHKNSFVYRGCIHDAERTT
jgi:hypothetical protein